MDEIVELIKSTEAENEDELVDALEEAGHSEDVVKAATVIARATNGMRDEINGETFLEIGKSMGYEFEIVTDEGTADEDGEDDTPINKSELPAEAREYLEDLEGRVEKMEEQSALDGFVQKAEEDFSSLTASSEELGSLLMDAHENMDQDNVETLKRVLKSSQERIESGDGTELDTEKGSSEPGAGNAEDDFFAVRDEIFEKNDDIETKEEATLKTAKEKPALYAAYKRQKRERQ